MNLPESAPMSIPDALPTRPIRFFHRGTLHHVSDAAPTRSLLHWLREDAHCTGTKEGCNEGDCGACTVVVVDLDPASAPQTEPALRLRNLNACLAFLPTLDGKVVLTVEDLAGIDAAADARAPALHPVQQALVDCHGSQCGFCTPGFAMTMTAVYERHLEQGHAAGTCPSRQQLADDLAGNLCRCTGYRPILDAAERMFDAPPRRLDRAALRTQLQQLAAQPPLHYAHAEGHFHAPRDLAEFAALRERLPQARLLGGATDVGLWVNKQFRALGDIVSINEVAELHRIHLATQGDRDELVIGAAATLEAAWGAMASHLPDVREVWQRFAAPPTRHAGTLGGNLANGSPIGDGAPTLMALGARLVLRRGAVERTLPLEDFYLAYMKNALQPGEFIARLIVPLTRASEVLRIWKVSKRYDCDISAVCGAFLLDIAHGHIRSARLAYGGLAGTVQRAAQAEAALAGQPWTEATLLAAQAALAQDFQPLTDLRASAAYRRQIAANLLRRLWLETRPDDPLDATQTTVRPATFHEVQP